MFPVLAVLGPEMGPDRPDLARYFVSDPNFPVASHCGPFRGRNVQKLIGPGLAQAWTTVSAWAWPRDKPRAWPRVRPRAWPRVRAQGLAQGHGPGLAQGPGQIISAK